MEDQLHLMNEMDVRFRIGDEIQGEILKIGSSEVFVSLIGYKTDGVIPFNELTYAENLEEALKSLKQGDSIKAKVIKLKNEDNYVVLSRLEYKKEETLEVLENYFNNKENFKVVIKEAKEKGIVASYNGVRVFIPASHIDVKFIKDTTKFINTEMEVRLIDFTRKNPSKVVASRRVILEEEIEQKEKGAWEKLNLGDVVSAEIKRFTNFGAFAEVYGVDGLIHISQISWKLVRSCDEVLTIGQTIKAKIIALDKENKKLSLSIKELTPEPWSNVEEKYPVGSAVLGKVVRINDFGAFVELEEGLDGLVHISKISHNHINHPSEVLKIGQDVKCIILDVNKDSKKIGLSIRDAE